MNSLNRKKLSLQMIFRYGVVGVLNTIAYAVTIILLVEAFRIDAVVSSVIGFIVSLIIAYLLNYSWTFESNQDHNTVLPKYIITSIMGLMLSTFIMFTAVDLLEVWYFYGILATTVFVPLFNFTVFYLWTFVPKHT